ncbi:MAG: hypothetical protein KC731_09040 [Myxococcales bacterium]|nr:hypothetical protein [Myxococcales bacterium]
MGRVATLAFALVMAHAAAAAAQTPPCDDDGTCAFPETCNSCPGDCGSCDVESLTGQVAKYIDASCEHAGDGSSDSCAAGPGQPGRFNDLQAALDSLVAGETLYIHAGAYHRTGDAFRIQGIGTAEAPIVITAADATAPPVIHSWDPAAPTDNNTAHNAMSGAEEPIAHIIVDGLHFDGGLRLHGDYMRMQNITCTHGWGDCDGNWSCLRFEGCNDCVAHHNVVDQVADLSGLCTGGANDPRESGMKEFTCTNTVWEHNTVSNTVRWGFDLHRSSFDSVVRYNLFRNAGDQTSIRLNRTGNQSAYGNVVLGGGGCIALIAEDAGNGFSDLVSHNTCLFAASGIYTNQFAPATVTHNVLGGLAAGNADLVNLALPATEDGGVHVSDRNAFDASSWWVTEIYQASYAMTLGDWQSTTGQDLASIAVPGGACSFVDAPSDVSDLTFDVSIDGGPCATLAESGGPVGACAVADCVGAACEACGEAPVAGTGGGGGAEGGAGGSGMGSGATGGAGGDGGGGNAAEDGEGCGCRLGGAPAAPPHLAWLLLVAALRRRRA